MIEYVGNMHIHTPYSDGEKYHDDIAQAAIDAGLDFIVVTDHNIWVDGLEGYVENGSRRVLMLIGEEVHDNRREPQANHLLVYGAERELSPYARKPQRLIDEVIASGGICFLAHPHDYAMPLFGGIPDLGWHDWNIEGYKGLEIWNYMSSFTNEITRKVGISASDTLVNHLRALPIALNPEQYITAPEQETLEKWDELLATGQRVAAVGNSDVHGTPMSLGPIKREIFPYEFCFRAVNTHILLTEPLSGELTSDKVVIYDALARGCGWVGYDMPHPTRGFTFSAVQRHNPATPLATMGDEVELSADLMLTATAPAPCEMRLILHGEVMERVRNGNRLDFRPKTPGAYRVECTIHYKGKQRGWIYNNPIYLNG